MEELRFYNTFTRRKEPFKPIIADEVRMYTCGPTVHDFAHLGNYRAYIFEDILRRTLKFFGYSVIQVMNLTDVDDKTIRKSRERGVTLQEYTREYTESFFEDLDALRIERAEFYPEATKHIPEMVELIEKLIANGHTYETDGSIYFRISSFPAYGRLANVKLDDLRSGVRVDSDEYEKEDVRDFALWKSWTPDDGDVFWDTSIGKGRPGWHIECSAMSTKYLGEHFDIHSGGVDNIFPHHENEIAQSLCGYGGDFVNVWMHNAHLMVNSEKMSKSLNNFFKLKEVTSTGISPRAVRYFLLSAHYRQPLNLVYDPDNNITDSFDAASGALDRIDEFRTKLAELQKQGEDSGEAGDDILDIIDKARSSFKGALGNDLDISGALGALFGMIKDVNRLLDEAQVTAVDAVALDDLLMDWDRVLGVIRPEERGEIDVERIEALIEERKQARQAKDFARSDEIRDLLASEGIIIQDTPGGVRWRKK
ncbi:cysteine--tRNA ligase [candidate division LCP-89 bacterium B3_LCP]|uniref:Cysteine--tRNA ligase n=1 Tax=candidate division LCP-89 bacterium B3_LCP TaxID=2012998 RepID=A0A532V1R4_UNCL8|nr:MAG: cysteine--tRNA ligase [candidate division LCP-89 bacterium B3_LCP]